ncbi:hypothetical protein ABH19_06740 [Leptospirillum sp. Group II 'CF-1']|nr:hypothetical protein ABH19_06740 [Leptospirillum sp. Group II 'CF-1']
MAALRGAAPNLAIRVLLPEESKHSCFLFNLPFLEKLATLPIRTEDTPRVKIIFPLGKLELPEGEYRLLFRT